MPWCSFLDEMQQEQFLRLIAMQLRFNRARGHVFLKHSLNVATSIEFLVLACAPHAKKKASREPLRARIQTEFCYFSKGK